MCATTRLHVLVVVGQRRRRHERGHVDDRQAGEAAGLLVRAVLVLLLMCALQLLRQLRRRSPAAAAQLLGVGHGPSDPRQHVVWRYGGRCGGVGKGVPGQRGCSRWSASCGVLLSCTCRFECRGAAGRTCERSVRPPHAAHQSLMCNRPRYTTQRCCHLLTVPAASQQHTQHRQ
jgi:hypothetical protein